jgi:lactoylglutathione lyase
MKLTHIRLLVNNYRDCFFFYRDVLGFEVGWGMKTPAMLISVPGQPNDQPSFAKSQDRVAVIFAVESVDEKFRQLRDKGVSFRAA